MRPFSRIRTASIAGAVTFAVVISACTVAPSTTPVPATAVTVVPAPAATSASTPTMTTTPTSTTPTALLAAGATGDQVRQLQARLKQLKHYTATVDGDYSDGTAKAVMAFQTAKKLASTGSVDQLTWDTLLASTKEPTAEDLAGHLISGPALLAQGSTGAKVRELQARLKQLGRWSGDVTDAYGTKTASAVKGYQTKRGLPVTGEVDQRTMDRIWSQTRKPTADELNNVKPVPVAGAPTATGLDSRCLVGRVICASKTTRKVVWVIDGVPILSMDARFGRTSLPTSEGSFRIYLKSRNHWSKKYDASMPLALFFNGGEAVHYSPEFASIGYGGVGSHGCVNTRDRAKMTALFDQARLGDRVVVYR